MDQGSYLSQALWHFRCTSKFTDLLLRCKDGSLPVHAAILAPFLTGHGIEFSSSDDVPDCLFLPDLDTKEVEGELEKIYRGQKATSLFELFKRKEDTVKLEMADYVDEHESKPFENYDLDTKESLDDDFSTQEDSYQDEDEPNVTEAADFAKEEVKEFSPEPTTKSVTKSTKRSGSAQKSKMMECNKCGDQCYGMGALSAHMKEYHGGKTSNVVRRVVSNGGKVCPYCEKKIKGKYAFPGHLAVLHREEMIKNHPEIELTKPCPDCELMFLGVADLDKHTRNVHSKSIIEWSCQFCDAKFSTKGLLRIHRKEKHPEECLAAGIKSIFDTKQCPYCETKCNSSGSLNGHIFHVHKDKRENHPDLQANYTCEHCNEEFYGKQRLSQHILKKHTENSYCKLCYKYFSDSTALKEHNEDEHSTPSTHVCDVCSKEFQTKGRLEIHIKRHERGGPRKFKFPCPHCKSGKYQKEEHLQHHILENHSGKEYFCSQCPMVFMTPQSRYNHEKRNHTEKKIKCDQCDMMFSAESYKNAHVKMVHIKEVNRICPHCGDGFRDKTLYEAHVNRHLNHRPHACDLCGKTYLTERDLKHHMDSHTLPYQCDKCEVRTGSKMMLKDHIRVVHDGLQLQCR